MPDEEKGADEYDGSVVDVGKLEAAEADAKPVEDEPEDKAQSTEADSPPAVEEDDEEKTSDEGKGFKSRIEKLNTKFQETDRDLTAAREREAAKDKRIEELEAAQPAEKQKTLADFNYDEAAFREYVVEDVRGIAREEARKVSRDYAGKTAESSAKTEYDKRESVFAETVDDFKDKVYAKDLSMSDSMVQVVREVDVGPELAYYLANNPDIASDISRMSPVVAGMEMSGLVTKIRSEKAKAETKDVSTAPPPPAKIKGGDAAIRVASTDPKSDALSDAEWFKKEDLRQAKLRG